MVEEKKVKSSKFINAVDENLRNSIISLDQRLRGLQAAFDTRLEYIRENDGNKEHERIIAQANSEVTLAIKSIKELVNMVISDDITDKAFLQINQENLEILRILLANQLEDLKDAY